MKQLIIGTAGHIDHGKTALIKALTGYDGDNLDEEKRRGITIDLSFSNIEENGNNISFIDVPGHEKLIKTMISGAFGFDAALLVVDAKEGLMPQSIEHLYILELIGLKRVVITLSKADLVSEEIIKKQTTNIKEFFKTSFKNLEIYDICPVSIHDKNSIETLKNTLFSLPVKEKIDRGIIRYYIDRVFSLKGVGAVVTGTILEGVLKNSSKVFVCELKKETTIKNLQVHEKNVQMAHQGQRVAINLSDISHNALKKGFLITQEGFIRGFNSADIFINLLPKRKIAHNSNVTFHIGAKAVEARILYYDVNKEHGFAKVEFKEELFLVFKEPFVITQSGHVVGGGEIINAVNDPLKKILKLSLLEALHKNFFNEAFEILINAHKKGFGLISSYQRFGLSHDEALKIANELDEVIIDEKNMVVYPKKSLKIVCELIENIYKKNRFALLSATSVSIKHSWISEFLAKLAFDILQKNEVVIKNGNIFQSVDIDILDIDTLVQDKILEILIKEDIAPTAPYNIYNELDIDRVNGDNALKKLTSSKKVVRLSHNLFISTVALSSIITKFREIIKNIGFIDIAEAKKHFNLSRKYLIAYLDYLDNFEDIKKIDKRRVFI